MEDIKNALNAGHEVTTHQSAINFKGWKGSGYIIIDPNNGSGAYMISGGANGAVAFFNGVIAGAVIALIALSIDMISSKGVPKAQLLAITTVMLGWFLTVFIATTLAYGRYLGWGDKEIGCFASGIKWGASAGTFGFKKAGAASGVTASILLIIYSYLEIKNTLPSLKDCEVTS